MIELQHAAGRMGPRFTMLETLREFARDRLHEAGESDLTSSRHAAHYLEVVEQLEGEFTGRDPRAALDRIGEEHANVRTALRFLVVSAPEACLRLASAMWRFWQMRGHLLEASRWLAEALEAAGAEVHAAIRAKGLAAAGGIAYWRPHRMRPASLLQSNPRVRGSVCSQEQARQRLLVPALEAGTAPPAIDDE